jgi:DNA ligase-1
VSDLTDFVELASVLDSVAATTKRKLKTQLAAEFLRKVDKSEVSQAALFLSGHIFSERDQRALNISWKGLLNSLKAVLELKNDSFSRVYEGDVGEAVARLVEETGHTQQTTLFSEPLTLTSVWKTAERIAEVKGTGSVRERESLLAGLFLEATPREAKYLAALFLGDMRTGLSEGLLAESIAVAYNIDPALIRRAWSFSGDLGNITKLAVEGGTDVLSCIQVELMRAVKPMLASPSDGVGLVLESTSKISFEMKLDGARVQIHKDGEKVRIFSRKLNDVTESLPDIVKIVQEKISAERVILDGEVLAVDSSGKPFPFQVVMTRFGRTRNIETAHKETKLILVLFDILLLNENHMVDAPYKTRRRMLEETAPNELIIERIVTQDITSASKFFEQSKELGHEGLVAKTLDSPYEPGVRGKHWLKIKHTLDTMDLVIIAAEWGHGRRSKWLSDYHLAVRDDESGEFVMIGKTYKGLTDLEFQGMTEELQKLEISSKRNIVYVKPQIIVEVLASEIQESPTYESGFALRFARIKRIREDKGPKDSMTLKELEDVFEKQFRFKAR